MFELYHGKFYSLFRDTDSLFWVLSNKFPHSVRYGPSSSFSHSFSLMKDANFFMNSITSKGVIFYD